MTQQGFSLQSGFLDACMRPIPAGEHAADHAEIARLRAEITKWRQRVPKLTEMLRLRGEALADAERRAGRLQTERDRLLEVQKTREASVVKMRTDPGVDPRRIERERFERDLLSLESRNRLLRETVEILTNRLSDAVAEIGRLREQREVNVSTNAVSTVDDTRVLLRIRGIGEKTLGLLQQVGIDSVESLAGLHEALLDDPQSALFPHRGRIRKQKWIAQARSLLGQISPDAVNRSESLPK
jgi:predicted flap endonuclease-1-like 5' DNA nuclease